MSTPNPRKRGRSPPPQFLDASSTITAARFSCARLPELNQLWNVVSNNTSQKPEHVGVGMLPSKRTKQSNDQYPMNKRMNDTIDALKSSGGKCSSRHLRRRTGAHIARRRYRVPALRVLGAHDETAGSAQKDDYEKKELKIPPRRARRKHSLLFEKHREWQKRLPPFLSDMDEDEASTTVLSVERQKQLHWMETHLWHAKRFIMSNMFGWSVPMQHSGRGAKAALRLSKLKCTLQDATWENQVFEVRCECMRGIQQLVLNACGGASNFVSKDSLSDQSVLSGNIRAEATLYHAGQFPKGAIGPAQFIFCSSIDGKASVRVHVHPSILKDSLILFHEIVSLRSMEDEDLSCTGPIFVDGGVSILRLRGCESTKILSRTLNMSKRCKGGGEDQCLWPKLQKCSKSRARLPSFSILPMIIDSISPYPCHHQDERNSNEKKQNGKTLESINCIDDGHDEQAITPTSTESLIFFDSSSEDTNEKIPCFLIYHKMEPDSNAELSSCRGWDIYCLPKHVKSIFCALNLHGACVIGFTEDCALRSEMDPPQLIFPRDYPDTAQGRLYWSKNCPYDWMIIRSAIGGFNRIGRCPFYLKQAIKRNNSNSSQQDRNSSILCKAIDWKALVVDGSTEEDSDDYGVVVVVRGPSFGDPFLKMLETSGIIDQPKEGTNRRRSRRSKSNKAGCRTHRPNKLSKTMAEDHSRTCLGLMKSCSSSLPALLACTLIMEGKGTIKSGAYIEGNNDVVESGSSQNREVEILGHATVGYFSQIRGCSHGICIVGAAKFLRAILDEGKTCIRTTPGGLKRIELRVWVRNELGEVPRPATLHPIF